MRSTQTTAKKLTKFDKERAANVLKRLIAIKKSWANEFVENPAGTLSEWAEALQGFSLENLNSALTALRNDTTRIHAGAYAPSISEFVKYCRETRVPDSLAITQIIANKEADSKIRSYFNELRSSAEHKGREDGTKFEHLKRVIDCEHALFNALSDKILETQTAVWDFLLCRCLRFSLIDRPSDHRWVCLSCQTDS